MILQNIYILDNDSIRILIISNITELASFFFFFFPVWLLKTGCSVAQADLKLKLLILLLLSPKY